MAARRAADATACRSRRRCSTAPARPTSSSCWSKAGFDTSGQVDALRRPHGRAVRSQGDGRLQVHAEAAPSGGRQDPRPLDRPLQPRHPAAAGRQGAVRRPALRRDGGVGARGLRRRLHAAGDADRQVRRRRRPHQGLRGDRARRRRLRGGHPGELQRARQGDARRSASTSSWSTRKRPAGRRTMPEPQSSDRGCRRRRPSDCAPIRRRSRGGATARQSRQRRDRAVEGRLRGPPQPPGEESR